MTTTLDIRILEILVSKVCHDLISPIGAVNNGIEFLTEMGTDDAGDALDLITFSAQQSSAKLQAYRMAYGSGGGDNSIKPEDVHAAIDAIVSAEDKISQDWDPYTPMGLSPETGERPDGFAKILICALLMSMDCLPKGGVIKVHEIDGKTISVSAQGEDAAFKDQFDTALSLALPQESLEPKLIHPYVMGLLNERYGFQTALSTPDTGMIGITITLP